MKFTRSLRFWRESWRSCSTTARVSSSFSGFLRSVLCLGPPNTKRTARTTMRTMMVARSLAWPASMPTSSSAAVKATDAVCASAPTSISSGMVTPRSMAFKGSLAQSPGYAASPAPLENTGSDCDAACCAFLLERTCTKKAQSKSPVLTLAASVLVAPAAAATAPSVPMARHCCMVAIAAMIRTSVVRIMTWIWENLFGSQGSKV
mmetsp:Transcript_40689/g.109976  ORF Transcript_40689/g.109976 Transcript_40689/m.109976 type:complete len:205 (+) Transcript_40689:834-1448(+)